MTDGVTLNLNKSSAFLQIGIEIVFWVCYNHIKAVVYCENMHLPIHIKENYYAKV